MLLGRTMQFDADFERKIRATTVEQVNAAFGKYVDAGRMVVVRAGDQAKAGQPVPPKP
jgi:zinc protease